MKTLILSILFSCSALAYNERCWVTHMHTGTELNDVYKFEELPLDTVKQRTFPIVAVTGGTFDSNGHKLFVVFTRESGGYSGVKYVDIFEDKKLIGTSEEWVDIDTESSAVLILRDQGAQVETRCQF